MDTLADAAARRRPLDSSSSSSSSTSSASSSSSAGSTTAMTNKSPNEPSKPTRTARPSSALSIQFLLDGSASRPFFVDDDNPPGGVDHHRAPPSPRTPDQDVDHRRSSSSSSPSSSEEEEGLAASWATTFSSHPRAEVIVLPKPSQATCVGQNLVNNGPPFQAYPPNQALMAPRTAAQPFQGHFFPLPFLAVGHQPTSSMTSSSSSSSSSSSYFGSATTTATPQSAMLTSPGAVLDLQVLSHLFLQSAPYLLPTFIPSPSASATPAGSSTTASSNNPSAAFLPNLSTYLHPPPPPPSSSSASSSLTTPGGATPLGAPGHLEIQQQQLQQHHQHMLHQALAAHLHHQQSQSHHHLQQLQLQQQYLLSGGPAGTPSCSSTGLRLPMSTPLTSRAGERPVHPSQPNREGGALTGGGGGCDRSTMLESILARAERNARADGLLLQRGVKREAGSGQRDLRDHLEDQVRPKRRRTASCGGDYYDPASSLSYEVVHRLRRAKTEANDGRSFSLSSGSSDGDEEEEEDEEEYEDEDEGGHQQQHRGRGMRRGRGVMSEMLYKRRQATPKQVVLLEQVFAVEPIPTSATKLRLAEVLEMSPKRVTVWFKNKRARQKKKGLPLPHSSSSPPPSSTSSSSTTSSSSISPDPGPSRARATAAGADRPTSATTNDPAKTPRRGDRSHHGLMFHYFDEDRAIREAAASAAD